MNNLRKATRTLAALAMVGAGGALALAVPAARADSGLLGGCPVASVSQPFTTWGDPASYELVPAGDFETGGWTLAGGAQLVAGSEPYAATGALGATSLSLPAGSSAQSPTTCVDLTYPTVRFFVAGTGSALVSIVDGNLSLPAGIVTAPGGWEPTPVMITTSPVFGLLGGGRADVSVRLDALSGDPRVDDVFIDPWNRH